MATTITKSQILNQKQAKKTKTQHMLITNSLNNFSPNSKIKMMKSNSYLPKINNNNASTNNYHYNTKINVEEFDLDNLENKEVFLKAYYKARRKMIVSKHLDEDFRNRLGVLKYENYEKRELIYPKKPKLKKEFSWFNDYYYKYQKDNNDSENRSSSAEDDESNFVSFKIDWSQLSKERLSNANKTTLPPIRFGSTLSKDAQFALMKSLEDQIVREIETSCPELTNKVPRTTTAQYSRKSKLSKSIENSSNSTSSNRSDYLSTNRSRLSILNSTNNRYESSEIFSNDDNFGFVNRELNVNSKTPISTNDTNKTDDNEIDMIKKLVITEQINSAMDILDNIRKVTKPKRQINKKLHFDNKLIDRLKFGPNNSAFNLTSMNSENSSLMRTPTLPPIQRSSMTSMTSMNSKQKRVHSRSSKIGRPPSTLAKLEPNLVKYNEWKSQWFNQLHNI